MNENNNNIPKGYKMTKLGVIPEEWEFVSVKKLGKIVTGNTPPTNRKDYYNGEYLFFSPSDLDTKKDVWRTAKTLTKIGFETGRFIPKGSVLFVSIGSTIGKTGYTTKNSITNQQINSVVPNESNSGEFIYYQLTFNAKRFSNIAGNQAVPLLNKSTFEKIKVFRPPLPEQQKIASILSTWDKAIATQEALITQKEQLKKGLMQALLTGKKRFAGFEEEWKEVKLGDVATCHDNLRKPLNSSERNEIRGNIPYCGANGVVDYINEYLIDDEIILIAEDGGYFDEFDTRPIAYKMKGKCWVNNHAHILKSKINCNQDYLFYNLVHMNIMKYLNGGTRAKLNKGELMKIKLNLTISIPEQQKIADTLSSADKEIENLKTQLATLKLQKQGLMQELLTGKRRVKLN